MPSICSDTIGQGLPGDACFGDAECASGECEGEETLGICAADGRTCTYDEDCPWADFGDTCVHTGLRDGTCQ